MKRTISAMVGKGSVNHNSRKFHAKNTDPERSHFNVEYCNDGIRDVYHELFNEALARYNEKQTRKDRRIDDYYEKIRASKQERPFHEIILQVGNKDNMGAGTQMGQLAAKVLDEYMNNFQQRNPTLRVFSAHLHMDEATPHLHIDFIPYTTGSNRGLDTRVSLKQALAALGFKGGTRKETEWNQWITAEKEQLATIMERHGIEWEHKDTHEKHLSVLDFEKQERAKEVAKLEEKKAELDGQNAAISEMNEKMLAQLENLEGELGFAQESKEKAIREAEKAKEQADKHQKRIERLAPTVKGLERWAVKYSSRPEEWVPEAGVLESGNSYRDRKAMPLISDMAHVIRNLYVKYREMLGKYNRLNDSHGRAIEAKERLRNQLRDALEENKKLWGMAQDFQKAKSVLGNEVMDSAVWVAKRQEQAVDAQRKVTKHKHLDRDAR